MSEEKTAQLESQLQTTKQKPANKKKFKPQQKLLFGANLYEYIDSKLSLKYQKSSKSDENQKPNSSNTEGSKRFSTNVQFTSEVVKNKTMQQKNKADNSLNSSSSDKLYIKQPRNEVLKIDIKKQLPQKAVSTQNNKNKLIHPIPQNKADSSAPLITFRGIQKDKKSKKHPSKIKKQFQIQQSAVRSVRIKTKELENLELKAKNTCTSESTTTELPNENENEKIINISEESGSPSFPQHSLQQVKSAFSNQISYSSDSANASPNSNTKVITKNTKYHDSTAKKSEKIQAIIKKMANDISTFIQARGEWKYSKKSEQCEQIQKIRSLYIFNSENEVQSYVTQLINSEIEEKVTTLLSMIVKFQTRKFKSNPIKSRTKRRFFSGSKSVMAELKSNNIKCVILATNIQPVDYLNDIFDEVTANILKTCENRNIPIIFSHKRRILGRILYQNSTAKAVSCVGLSNIEGAEPEYKEMLLCSEKLSEDWLQELCNSAISRNLKPDMKWYSPIVCAAWYKNWKKSVLHYIIMNHLGSIPISIISANEMEKRILSSINELFKVPGYTERFTPLHIVSIRNNTRFYSLLTDSSSFFSFYVDFKCLTFKKELFLHLAFKNNSLDIVLLFLEHFTKQSENKIESSISLANFSSALSYTSVFDCFSQQSFGGVSPVMLMVKSEISIFDFKKIVQTLKKLYVSELCPPTKAPAVLFDVCVPISLLNFPQKMFDKDQLNNNLVYYFGLLDLFFNSKISFQEGSKYVDAILDLDISPKFFFRNVSKIENYLLSVIETLFEKTTKTAKKQALNQKLVNNFLICLEEYSWIISAVKRSDLKSLKSLLKRMNNFFSLEKIKEHINYKNEYRFSSITGHMLSEKYVSNLKFLESQIETTTTDNSIMLISDNPSIRYDFSLNSLFVYFLCYLDLFYCIDKTGKSLFWYSCYYGSLSVCKLLISTEKKLKSMIGHFIAKMEFNQIVSTLLGCYLSADIRHQSTFPFYSHLPKLELEPESSFSITGLLVPLNPKESIGKGKVIPDKLKKSCKCLKPVRVENGFDLSRKAQDNSNSNMCKICKLNYMNIDLFYDILKLF
ncbi:hypothetical protein BB560_004747 [Smittium megazygosporum]|uniref:Ribosomal protein eL8/eL30/eS12/Gadd45 domain-containing protein n=1 Tax=Smittium megazygosporum TaxID=133381 RepID=A0A2T9Z8H7_9FUNG|nr:hypothetical protein BB560_004747 [Smittium megazygosporum]